MIKIINKNPLYFAFLLPAIIDGFLTLFGQSSQYWSANRIVNEASPVYYFLLHSPWLFVLGSFFWFAFWYWIFKRLKEPFNLFIMFLFISGHSWGSSSWIWNIMKRNQFYNPSDQFSVILAWFIVVLYFGVIALTATYCLRNYFQNKKNPSAN